MTTHETSSSAGDRSNSQNPGDFLGQHRSIVLATLGPDGLPHAVSLPYWRDRDDVYVTVDPASRTARNLGAVGPVAGTVDDQDAASGRLSLQLRGSAELIADPDLVAKIATSGTISPGQAASERSIYRIVADELRLLAVGEDTPAITGDQTASTLVALRSRLEERTATPGEDFVRQGAAADRFYVIVSGECEVVREGGGGRQVLARLGPGRFFGETGLLAGVPRTATVTAVTDTRTLTLNRANFRAALAEAAPTAEALARLIYELTSAEH